MLKPGDRAPGFTLTSDEGRKVSLADFAGRRVVLYFYPKADTPGCTQQACALRDLHPDVEEADVTVIGVSPDAPEKLAAFRAKYDLPFVLLSDPERSVAAQYGAWGERKLYGRTFLGVLRSHVAIDAEGRIAELDLNVKPLETAELARRVLAGGTTNVEDAAPPQRAERKAG
ncbi:MAG: thioredoxin-dependent thiol peroxidase [Candidatus Bipolaricaulota bacterium]